ncbi:hypothetical protein Pelo_1961 [Pelomyxa schiedti]|nr:hypothetical protein Pelo_1961 [Pelomyxa schiedti]
MYQAAASVESEYRVCMFDFAGTVLATTNNKPAFPATTKAEREAIVKCFADNDLAQREGITLGGTKYLCLQATPSSVYGMRGKHYCVCVKSVTAIAVCVDNTDDHVMNNVVNRMESVAAYMVQNNI